MTTKKGWEALTDPDTTNLITRVPFGRLEVPEPVTIESGSLCFPFVHKLKFVRVPETLLARFLAADTDQRILRFAQRYGPIKWSQLLSNRELHQYEEPLVKWRALRWELSYLLSLAASAREDMPVNTDPWQELINRGIREPRWHRQQSEHAPSWNKWSKSRRRDEIMSLVEERATAHIARAGLRPALDTDHERAWFRIVFSDPSRSLHGVLVGQFLAAVIGSGIASCSACGNIFVPKRRQPAFGKRRYCQRCGHAAAVRDAKADFRKRARAQKARSDVS
jgi:hypothetical protein